MASAMVLFRNKWFHETRVMWRLKTVIRWRQFPTHFIFSLLTPAHYQKKAATQTLFPKNATPINNGESLGTVKGVGR